MQCLCMAKGIQAKGGQTTILASLAPGDVEVQLRGAQAHCTPLHADTGVLTARFYRRLPRSKRAAENPACHPTCSTPVCCCCCQQQLLLLLLLLLLLVQGSTASAAATSFSKLQKPYY
jgi:hypothetical protein